MWLGRLDELVEDRLDVVRYCLVKCRPPSTGGWTSLPYKQTDGLLRIPLPYYVYPPPSNRHRNSCPALMEADTNYDGDLTLEEFDELVEDRPDVVR